MSTISRHFKVQMINDYELKIKFMNQLRLLIFIYYYTTVNHKYQYKLAYVHTGLLLLHRL